MRKTEIKTAKDNELIAEYVRSYGMLLVNYSSNRGTKQFEKHCHDLEVELLKRGLLTEDDIKKLEM